MTDLADPRILALAAARQNLAADGSPITPTWDRLHPADQEVALHDAERYLTAAIRAGLVPPALSDAERQFLSFALDLAFDQMCSGDGFTDEDDAALASLRKLAGGETS